MGNPPDDRVVVGQEDPHPDGDRLDDAIDSLLGDAAEVRAEETEPPAAPSADDPASDPASGEAADETDQAGTLDSGASALDAMDSVEQNAQALIEDAIDDLIDQDEEGAEPAAEDIASLEVEDLAGDDDGTMSLDELSAELDALDDGEALATPSDSASEAPAEQDVASGVAEPIDGAESGGEGTDAEPESEPGPEAAEDVTASVERLNDNELLSSIAEDLLEEPAGGDEAAVSADDAHEQGDGRVGGTSSTASEVAGVDDELMSAAIDVLDDAGPDTADQTAAPADEADVAGAERAPGVDTDSSSALEDASTLADLDASLAGLGDDFLSGDFETPEGELLSSDSIGANDASVLLEQLQIGDLNLETFERPARAQGVESREAEARPEGASAASATPPGASGGATVPAIPPKAQPKPNAAPFEREDSEEAEGEIPEVESIWQSAQRGLLRVQRAAWSRAKTHGVPLGAKLVILVNRPVEDRPAKLRDSIGYVALWTALLAMILWVYLVFVRESPTPNPTQAPSRMVEPGERIDPLRNASVEP